MVTTYKQKRRTASPGALLLAVALFCALSLPSRAQNNGDVTITLEEEYTDAYLDSIDINKSLPINDYFLVGLQYGGGLHWMDFNPTKRQGRLPLIGDVGATVTFHNKMFGMMPYFGLQVGAFYGRDGYVFKQNDEGEYSSHVDGAVTATYNIAWGEMLSHFHVDIWKIKLIAEAGPFLGYRLSIHREGPWMDPEFADTFHDYERRWEFGVKGGAGIGVILDPIEVHFKAGLKWGWSSLYEPDYNSPYYYRFAYPLDIVISVGVHYQLTKRTGKTSHQLRREARDLVYNRGAGGYETPR